MKRALMVASATAVGLFAALSYTPRMAVPAVSAAPAPTTPATSAAPTAAAAAETAAAAAPAAPSAATAVSGTFTGTAVSTRYGDVQVAVTVTAGKVTDVTALAFPSADTKSAAISASAIPVLREETIAAQSAEVAAISGATYTSQGWQESAAAALAQAGL